MYRQCERGPASKRKRHMQVFECTKYRKRWKKFVHAALSLANYRWSRTCQRRRTTFHKKSSLLSITDKLTSTNWFDVTIRCRLFVKVSRRSPLVLSYTWTVQNSLMHWTFIFKLHHFINTQDITVSISCFCCAQFVNLCYLQNALRNLGRFRISVRLT